jgi:hypothetical protein
MRELTEKLEYIMELIEPWLSYVSVKPMDIESPHNGILHFLFDMVLFHTTRKGIDGLGRLSVSAFGNDNCKIIYKVI